MIFNFHKVDKIASENFYKTMLFSLMFQICESCENFVPWIKEWIWTSDIHMTSEDAGGDVYESTPKLSYTLVHESKPVHDTLFYGKVTELINKMITLHTYI